jgi:outer membrane protein TolC
VALADFRRREQAFVGRRKAKRGVGGVSQCAIALVAFALALTGCADAFRTSEDEYGLRVARERLHDVEPLGLPPAPVSTQPEHGDPPRALEPPAPAAQTIDVTIEEARAFTLQNNLDLQVTFVSPQIAEAVLREEEAAFESAFFGRASVSDAEPGQAEVFRDEFIRPLNIEPGVRIPLRTGGTASVSLPLAESESFDIPGEQPHSADVKFTLTHELMRGAGRWTNTYGIRIASLESQIEQARAKLEVIRQIANADRAYWLLYAARRTLVIRQEQYEQAVNQWSRAEARRESMVGAEIDVTRAKAGVTQRLAAIIAAELSVKDRQRDLKRIMNISGVDVDSEAAISIVSPPNPVAYELHSQQLIAMALERRMELLELELRIAQDVSTIDLAENQKLPLFTLDYTYRQHGRGTNFSDAFSDLAELDSWGWQLGVNADVPLGNEAAEARYHRAILIRLQRLSTRSSREQAIKQEVLGAIDNLVAAWEQIKAAQQNIGWQEANYRAEQGQYNLGLRTSKEVLDAETSLAEARLDELNAVVEYQLAQIDLAFATGTLLGASKVSW